jgi:hypothetical protein
MEEFWYQLETMVPWVRGVDRMPLMIGALGLVVAVFWLMSRKGGGGGGGRRSLDAAYRKIENADIDQWQRPYALIATRPPWDDLPQYFLMELTARLIDKENLFEFILLTEKHKLARQRIPKIAQSDAGTAMGMLSEELANLAGRLRGREAETAYSPGGRGRPGQRQGGLWPGGALLRRQALRRGDPPARTGHTAVRGGPGNRRAPRCPDEEARRRGRTGGHAEPFRQGREDVPRLRAAGLSERWPVSGPRASNSG